MNNTHVQHPLKGCNVLFLSPSFFNYELEIIKEMEALGARVLYYDERSVKSALGKGLLKFCPRLVSYFSQNYYKQIINDVKGKDIDKIFVIKCEMLSERFLTNLKELFPTAKMYLYLFDSVKNIKGIDKKLSYFDKISSFDRVDCISRSFNFRPLFFSNRFKCEEVSPAYEYDLIFCGTIHSDRYKILKELELQINAYSLAYYKFYYLQAKFVYYYYKLLFKAFKSSKIEEFAFNKMSISEIASMQLKSKAIIDIQHPNQTGLTMRTIETIALNRKIITTNGDIVNYDFYNPNNILIINRNTPKLDLAFLNSPYEPLPSIILERYTIRQWVLDILFI